MSVISQFNKLDGKTVSIKKLHDLQDKAYNEHQKGNKKAFEVWKRIQNLLDNYPKATVFTLEIENPISEKSSLGSSINKIVKGNELIYYQDKQKLATIKDNGVITYHKKRLPSGLRNEIRKAANIIGLSSPYSENPVDESMLNGLEYIPEEVEFTGLGKPVSQNDIYNYVTDLIINTIKKVGHLPWQKEWIGGGSENEAKNYVTKKTYNGINFLLLNFDIKYDKLTGYNYLVPIKFEQPYYLTFNQIEEAGAKLKAGSKAHRVIYYTMIFSYKNGDLEISTTDKAKYSEFIKSNGITAQQIKEFGKKIPVIKYYNVYRADDCTGLKFPPKPKPKKTTPIEQAQAIIDGYPNPPKYTFVGADAYYQPANDLVNMPKIAAFTKEEFYYSTFFHEIIHSTGHSKRLDRGNDTRKRDGGQEDKKAYAFEELVAELGAVFLCSEAGILFTTVENSAKYLKGWNSRLITELENDNRFFLKASAQAQKAANWILDRNTESNVQKTSKKTAKIATKTNVAKPKTVKKQAVSSKSNGQSVTKKAKTVIKEVKNVTKKVETVQKTTQKPKSNATKKLPTQKKVANPKSFANIPKSVSVKTAIADVLTLPKFKGISSFAANVVFRVFANIDPIDTQTQFFATNAFQKQVLLNEDLLQDFSTWDDSSTLTDYGVEFIKAVKARLESLQNSKHNYSMFEGLRNPVEQVITIVPSTPIVEEEITVVEPVVVNQPKPTNKLMQMQFDSLPMDDGWEELMQNPAANMKIAIFGPPKNGKTAASLQMANYLTKFGNVLYNFADQGFNLSTQKLWIESGLANNPKAEPSDINTLAALDKEIATGKYKFVFIDMISDYIRLEKIKPEEFKANFMRKYPDVSFILIFEVTKAGTFKGDEGWMHVVDAIMNVEHFVISNRGRYGFGKRVIWEEGFANSDPKGYAEWLENNTEEVQEEVILNQEIERI